MKLKNLFIPLLALIFLFLLLACDAPRENPFDPGASNYHQDEPQLITSKIYVRHLYPPFAPIADAQLIIKNLNLFLSTNSQGYVTFEHQPVDTLDILIASDGYFPKNEHVAAIPSHTYTLYLNAKPQINEIHFTSIYNNFEQGQSATNLSILARISDLDSPLDLSSVMLKNDTYHFAIELTRSADDNEFFSKEFYVSQIASNLNNAQLPELNFFLVVKNLNGDSVKTGPYSIRRVIENELNLLSPMDGQTVRDSVQFKWVNPELPYDYTFNIELLKFPTFESINYRDIPKDQDSFTLKNLAKGRYSWRLEIEDNLGNLCQSYYINFYYE